jgi:hypothetical protein
LYLKRVGERDRHIKQAIAPSNKVNLKKQGKFCANGSVIGESTSKRTSAIGEVGPPLGYSRAELFGNSYANCCWSYPGTLGVSNHGNNNRSKK